MMPYCAFFDLSGYAPINENKTASFSVISENNRIFAS